MCVTPVDPKIQNVADIVASELGETERGARRAINRAVQVLGLVRVVALASDAKKLQGQLLTVEGKPRTLGGCFFYLLQRDLGGLNTVQRQCPHRIRQEKKRNLPRALREQPGVVVGG